MNKSRTIKTALLAAVIVAVFSLPASAVHCIPIQLQSGTSFTHDDIPFEYLGVSMLVIKDATRFVPVQTLDLSGYTADNVYILQAGAYSGNVPDNVVVGHVNVFYEDGSSTGVDLEMGVNIAEWAWHKPEAAGTIQHSDVDPAYVYDTFKDSPISVNSGTPYQAQKYCVSIDTEIGKALDYLELKLDPAAYTGQSYFGYAPADYFGITVQAVTVEVVPEPATLAILGLGGLALLHRRRI